ncbi:uncharacterized protein LOC129919126 [Episyrphus balteatus]|uniref:uncharacterized protein LOC129919126 n=1 Tax=Episyrphus balteatus TaxID=286459 RepID=UPI002485A881|nr:uncharacterized protein LOC129919126 [Episyrphus balteatus]
MNILIVSLALFSVIGNVHSWNLAPLGLNDTYRLLHVSTYYIRAFLCVEFESKSQPTLIESFWPENFFALAPKAFPNNLAHARGERSKNCKLIQQAILTQIDSWNRLWLLDKGTRACRPKLIVYDLLRDNHEIFRTEIDHFRGHEVITMKLGPTPTCCQVEEKAFFVIKNKPYLLTFDLLRHTWEKVSISSRLYENIQQIFPVHPKDIAFGYGNQLLIAEQCGKFFLVDSRFNGTKVDAEYMGNLIGSPRGMIVDAVGTMYYLVPKFGAVIRCLPKKGLTAEGNEIISLTSLPINQIFFGVQGSVWLASETPIFAYDHCHRLLESVGVAGV